MYNRYVRNDNGTYTRIPEESQVPPPSVHEMHAHHEYDPSHPVSYTHLTLPTTAYV